ncbi:MAG: HD domain-containing protein [Verrucomicrobiota bacterium]|nr:HD domain-containing protein [Verrucomicrobiota bacterium]
MTGFQLQEIQQWFKSYTGTFASSDGFFHPPLQLKVDHSQRVADNARQLAKDLGWNPAEANRAEALGWLHDVGRFSQFAEFGTFTDATSVNHGERGREIVRQSEILSALEPEEQNALLGGIRHHNAKTEPDHLEDESLRFLKLIRDADKLDIFRIVLDSVRRDGFQDLPGMLPQVVLAGPVTPRILHEIQTHRSCSIAEVRSLADFLLMQLGWVYDLNYPASFRLVLNRNTIENLEHALPGDHQIQQVAQAIRDFAKQKTERDKGAL